MSAKTTKLLETVIENTTVRNNVRKQTLESLLKIFILDLVFLTAYSPSEDHTNSSAVPYVLFLHAKAVYIVYSPSPQTTTSLPFVLCFKI